MTAPALLLALAAATGWLGGRLDRVSWLRRAPRWGILLWQALSWCFVSSLVLAGAALALPAMPMSLSAGVASFLGACADAIRDHYATPAGAAAAAAGTLLATMVLARIGGLLALDALRVHRSRRRQRAVLELIARRDRRLDAWIVDDDRPAAYCLPGRGSMVVLTSGALRDLAGSELDAVLAHERAHTRGHHDLVVRMATTLRAALPGVPLLRAAATQIPTLVEMHADDRAASAHGRRPLATALVQLAEAIAPTAVAPAAGAGLLATGGETLARVQRLGAREAGLSRSGYLVAAAVVALVAVAPAGAAAAPAVEAALLDYCPIVLR